MNEVDPGKAMRIDVLKEIAGGDVLTARLMRQDFVDFEPSHKPTISANSKPRINAPPKDPSWRRIHLINWPVTLSDREMDLELGDKLRGPGASGMLNEMLDGCLEWQKKEGLNPPASVLADTADFRDESDTLGDFVDELLIVEANAEVTLGDLHTKYVSWCDSSGLRHPLAKNGLAKQLNEREIGHPDRDKQNRAIRKGVRLRKPSDDPKHAEHEAEVLEALNEAFGIGIVGVGIVVDNDVEDESASDNDVEDETDAWLSPGAYRASH
jgi:putative DNA primase/helicase